MRKIAIFMSLLIMVAFIHFILVPLSHAQDDVDKKFMKMHQKEMETFMNRCSGCHSLQRVFAQKRTKEEWNKILQQMAGKPHALISEEEAKRIRKWIDLMEAAMPVGP